MLKVNNFITQNLISAENQLTIIDLITLRILMNFNIIVVSAICFLGITLINIPFFQALGWVGYIVSTLLVIFVQIRFTKFWFAGFLFLILALNCYQLFSII